MKKSRFSEEQMVKILREADRNSIGSALYSPMIVSASAVWYESPRRITQRRRGPLIPS